MKRVWSALLALMMALSLAACGGTSTEETGTGADEGGAVVIRVGMTASDTSNYMEGLKVFEQKLEEYSDGFYDVQIFPSGQLGNERDLVENVALGNVEACVTASGLTNLSANFMAFDFPYLISDKEAAFEVMDGEIGQELMSELEPKGIVGLGYWDNGFRHITSNKEIKTPEDIQGFKLRVMENQVHMTAFEEVGANPVPMAIGEVYAAMQQGTIDGHENALIHIYTNKFYEVQKYITLTGHVYSPAFFLISRTFFENQSEEMQEAIRMAEAEARTVERDFTTQADEELVQTLRDAGNIVNEVDRTVWKAAFENTCQDLRAQVDSKYLDALAN